LMMVVQQWMGLKERYLRISDYTLWHKLKEETYLL
jgi:hypothetical protein